jgi:prolyl-tRNA editing enzyme YbaK/EbsC (Cys-tRNA(Pro) deacylase)
VTDLPRSARRVQEALRVLGLPDDVRVLGDSTRTAPEAAATVGCELGAIVKSLVFRGAASGEAVLALVSGDNRADEDRVAAAVGEPVLRADADFVRAATGYAIGGVAPVGHPRPLRTVVDEDLLRFETVWAAAGTPRAVFGVAPAELFAAMGAAPAAIAGRAGGQSSPSSS